MLSSDARSVVYVSGKLDAYTAAPLRESLAGLISAGARQGKLLLRTAPPSVSKIIEITGLDPMLPRIRDSGVTGGYRVLSSITPARGAAGPAG